MFLKVGLCPYLVTLIYSTYAPPYCDRDGPRIPDVGGGCGMRNGMTVWTHIFGLNAISRYRSTASWPQRYYSRPSHTIRLMHLTMLVQDANRVDIVSGRPRGSGSRCIWNLFKHGLYY
jgi:hypothetical protein